MAAKSAVKSVAAIWGAELVDVDWVVDDDVVPLELQAVTTSPRQSVALVTTSPLRTVLLIGSSSVGD